MQRPGRSGGGSKIGRFTLGRGVFQRIGWGRMGRLKLWDVHLSVPVNLYILGGGTTRGTTRKCMKVLAGGKKTILECPFGEILLRSVLRGWGGGISKWVCKGLEAKREESSSLPGPGVGGNQGSVKARLQLPVGGPTHCLNSGGGRGRKKAQLQWEDEHPRY